MRCMSSFVNLALFSVCDNLHHTTSLNRFTGLLHRFTGLLPGNPATPSRKYRLTVG